MAIWSTNSVSQHLMQISKINIYEKQRISILARLVIYSAWLLCILWCSGVMFCRVVIWIFWVNNLAPHILIDQNMVNIPFCIATEQCYPGYWLLVLGDFNQLGSALYDKSKKIANQMTTLSRNNG